jgi:hypothetical protein
VFWMSSASVPLTRTRPPRPTTVSPCAVWTQDDSGRVHTALEPLTRCDLAACNRVTSVLGGGRGCLLE